MKRIIIGVITTFLLIGAQVFAANGDFYVNGNLGIGTTNPQMKFLVSGADAWPFSLFAGASKGLRVNLTSSWSEIEGVDNTGVGSYQPLRVGGSYLAFTIAGAEAARIDANGNVGIRITAPTHLLQLSGGAYSDGTTWVNASSRSLKDNINALSSDAALKALDGLTPITFNYKTDAEDKHVGFIAEDVPDLVATKDRKGLSALDIVAVLTKVVQEQRKTIDEMRQEQRMIIESMQEKIERLEKQAKSLR